MSLNKIGILFTSNLHNLHFIGKASLIIKCRQNGKAVENYLDILPKNKSAKYILVCLIVLTDLQ